MYLSQLKLNLRNRVTQNWIRNPYHIHQRLWMAFSEGFEKKDSESAPFLYRFESNIVPGSFSIPRILVFSSQLPDWHNAFKDFSVLERIPEKENIKEVLSTFIQVGVALRFSVIANPTKKVKDYRSLFREELKIYPEICDHSNQTLYVEGKTKLEELKKLVTKEQREKLKSKKVGIYQEKEQLEWLSRRGLNDGFEILNANIDSFEDHRANKSQKDNRREIPKIHTVTFSGILRITDPEKFKIAYTKGIGSGKAFGCGMLLLARV